MNALYLYNLLLSSPAKGLLWFLLLFLACLVGVHIARLALLGWEYKTQKQKPQETPPPPEKEQKKTPAQTSQEPIYYIVERKTRRPKTAYGEPKQINFRK